MLIGVPKERKVHEYRVALTPVGVSELTRAGHQVIVEREAGVGSSLPDELFVAAGAEIVPAADEVWARADLVLKVKEPVPEEFERLRSEQTLFTYLHLAASRPVTDALLQSGTTAIAYETVQTADGRLPLLAPMSEIAGRMAAQVGAHLLEREQGGRGVLMGGVSGVAPANIVVLGAGMAGYNAALVAAGMGAHVTVLDTNVDALRRIDAAGAGRIFTRMSTAAAIDDLLPTADVVIGSVLIPGARAPKLVTMRHVEAMQTGSVLVDIAIDQGGCFATSHVTTHAAPTFVVDGVVHYCVGNMPGAVPHTSTYALTNVTLPYVLQLAAGAELAVRTNDALARGVNVWKGQLTSAPVAAAFDLASQPLHDLISN